MAKRKNVYCSQCGSQLTAENSSPAPYGWCEDTGYTYFCRDCQQEHYEKIISRGVPAKTAVYICCAAFNVPYVADCIPLKTKENLWLAYLAKLKKNGKDVDVNGDRASFFDGAMELDETKNDAERTKIHEQRQRWGNGPEKRPYSPTEYDELDAFYDAYAEQLDSKGGPDAQQQHTLRLCARCNTELNRALADGDPAAAQKYNKMIQDNLGSESLRKKDTKPLDNLRIDTVVDALEKNGYLRDGKILDYDELLEKLRGDVPHYKYTRDAADQMLLHIMNTMRANEGMSEYTELPIDYRIKDEKGEFAETPNGKEVKAYNQLGLIREGVTPGLMLKNKPSRVKRQKTHLQPKAGTPANTPHTSADEASTENGGD